MAGVKKSTRGYHHGDLRRTLLNIALEELRQGHHELSFRRLAATARVASSAPYNHFRDRDELLAVLAGEGFGILRSSLLTEVQKVRADPHTAIKTLARTYVRFGRSHFAHYRIMFLPVVTKPANVVHVHQQAQACFDLLLQVLSGVDVSGDKSVQARAIWCALHGLVLLGQEGAVLSFDSEIGAENAFVDSLVCQIIK